MLFNSIQFMVFFPVSLIGYYLSPKKNRYVWLLICSYYFYMSWNPRYVLLILASTIVTYLGGVLIWGAKKRRYGRQCEQVLLFLVILFNIGILMYFKYSNFLLNLVETIVGFVGIKANISKIDVILPVGISFYTFQALGYSIDVYKGEVEPERNFLKYALFVSFFPQLVAGPIERTKNLLTQVNEACNKKFDIKKIYHGTILILWGLFLKMVISDRVSVLVDTVFDNYYLYGGIELIIASIAFSVQIYCDFCSYSIIAVGTAETLGFSLVENFSAPYLSGSIKEFWRRWHISLSTWFRDYIYIPLGGNRKHKYRNIMITFLISGLWHGASIKYIVWGGVHGLYQVLGELLTTTRKRIVTIFKINTRCFSFKLSKIIGTFVLTDISWIFFRANNVQSAFSFLSRIFWDFNPWILSSDGIYRLGVDRFEMNILFGAIIVLIIADLLKYYKNEMIVDFVLRQNIVFQFLFIGFILLYILIFGVYGAQFIPQAFIYFQF